MALTQDHWFSVLVWLPTTDIPKAAKVCRLWAKIVHFSNWSFWKAKALKGRLLKSPFDHIAIQIEAYLRATRAPLYNYSLPDIWRHNTNNLFFKYRHLTPRDLKLPKPVLLYLYLSLIFEEVEPLSLKVFNWTLVTLVAVKHDQVELVKHIFNKTQTEFSDNDGLNLRELLRNIFSACCQFFAKQTFLAFLPDFKGLTDDHDYKKSGQLPLALYFKFSTEEWRIFHNTLPDVTPLYLETITRAYQRYGPAFQEKLRESNPKAWQLLTMGGDLFRSLTSTFSTEQELVRVLADGNMFSYFDFYHRNHPLLRVCYEGSERLEKDINRCSGCSESVETYNSFWWHTLIHPLDEFVINVAVKRPVYCWKSHHFYSTSEQLQEHEVRHPTISKTGLSEEDELDARDVLTYLLRTPATETSSLLEVSADDDYDSQSEASGEEELL